MRAGGSKYQDLRQGRLSLLPGLTAPLQKLLHALMAPDPADRPSAAKVWDRAHNLHDSLEMLYTVCEAEVQASVAKVCKGRTVLQSQWGETSCESDVESECTSTASFLSFSTLCRVQSESPLAFAIGMECIWHVIRWGDSAGMTPQVLASPPLVRRAPARETGKENYGALNLQPSMAPACGR